MSRITLRALMATALLAVVLPLTTAAQDIPLDKDGLPAWETKVWTDFPVEIVLQDLDQVQPMLDAVPIAYFDRSDVRPTFDSNRKIVDCRVVTRVTRDEFEALADAGYAPKRVEDADRANRERMEAIWADMYAGKNVAGIKTDPLNYVPTNDQLGTMLQGLEATYPTMAKYFTWGSSVNGRTLHGLVISDNVNQHEAEPEVRYSGTMHGDEVTGLVMSVNLAYYLLENYGQPGYEDVTDIVDNFELHLMPAHNPDGTASHSRYNANSVDLNRNFLLPAGTHGSEEQENLHFKDYANAHHFVVSINFHGGALVMNYLWDYTYALCPDDAACIQMSLGYSTTNIPMYNGSFSQGITNGADWYVATGTLQDWSYDQTDCIDVTGEISNTKWPSNSSFPGFWNDNRESMMTYILNARDGSIHGVVTDVDTGQPLDATITLVGNAKSTHTDPANGDYYKMADTGTYDVTIEALGYVTQTFTDVNHVWGTGTTLDVQMHPLATGHVSGTVRDLHGAGLDAFVEIRTWPGGELVNSVSTTAASGGAFALDVFYGDYSLTATAVDHFTETQQVVVSATPAVVNFELGGMITLYPIDEDFEDGMGVFSGDWTLLTPGNGGGSCIGEYAGTYPDNAELTAVMNTPVDLTDVMDPQVSFSAKWDIEDNWDGVFFEVSFNGGGSWTSLAVPGRTVGASGQGAQQPSGTPCFEGSQANWVSCVADLSPYIGETDVRFRFRFASDTSVHEDGFYVDDFQVKVTKEDNTSTAAPIVPALTARVSAYPNPFNPQTTVKLVNPRQGKVSVNVYDVHGRLIRTLLDGELPAGGHEVSWDGIAENGRPANSGVYFARFVAADGSAVGSKLVLVK